MDQETWNIIQQDRPLLHVDGAGLSDDAALRKLRVTFHMLIVGEIRRALEHEIGVASMILCCCAIDFLGSLYAGQHASGATLKAFVQRFLRQYDPAKLAAMRNRLVHNYVVPPEAYNFTVGREHAPLHLSPGGRSLIVVDEFVDDIQRAGEELFRLAGQEGVVHQNVLARLRERGLLWMSAFTDQGGA